MIAYWMSDASYATICVCVCERECEYVSEGTHVSSIQQAYGWFLAPFIDLLGPQLLLSSTVYFGLFASYRGHCIYGQHLLGKISSKFANRNFPLQALDDEFRMVSSYSEASSPTQNNSYIPLLPAFFPLSLLSIPCGKLWEIMSASCCHL
jgi:hypothetical protein